MFANSDDIFGSLILHVKIKKNAYKHCVATGSLQFYCITNINKNLQMELAMALILMKWHIVGLKLTIFQ